MRIVYIDGGIEVFYNTHESFLEYIFGIDDNGNLVQNITFDRNIYLDMNNFNNSIKNYTNKSIEKGYLFYSFTYEVAFGHYIGQTVPKLYEYLQSYRDHKLLIPKHRYNNLCKDILQLINIDLSQIEIIEDGYIYDIKDFVTTTRYHCVPTPYTNTHIEIYKKIREPLMITENTSPYRKVYLKRDGKPCAEFGNSETGILRQIVNEAELISQLEILGFEIITLGDKHISEKKDLLNNINILVTPLGANCTNLIFCNAPKYIIYLSNTENFGDDYYTQLASELNNTHIVSHIFRYSGESSDPKNEWNNKFNVNINDIINFITSI